MLGEGTSLLGSAAQHFEFLPELFRDTPKPFGSTTICLVGDAEQLGMSASIFDRAPPLVRLHTSTLLFLALLLGAIAVQLGAFASRLVPVVLQ